MSAADRRPVDAAVLAEAFRRTDAAWKSVGGTVNAETLYDAAAATTACAALTEEAGRYAEEYTAEYAERSDLEALYAAAAWAKVAAWAAKGAVKAMTAKEEAEEEAWYVAEYAEEQALDLPAVKDEAEAWADQLAERAEAWAVYFEEEAVDAAWASEDLYADLLGELEARYEATAAMEEEKAIEVEEAMEEEVDAAEWIVEYALRAAATAWAAASQAVQRIATLEHGPGSSPAGLEPRTATDPTNSGEVPHRVTRSLVRHRKSGKEPGHDTQILECVARRGITRLVHFTRLSSLQQIIQDRNILSIRQLRSLRRFVATNDSRRLDRHIDYICCSIQWPNVYVLDRYLQKFPDTQWVVLFLHTDLLGQPATRFSPVNAATDLGHHVHQGIAGFRSLFAEEVPGDREIRRGPQHLWNCPTDIQAEVLVKDTIPTSFITKAIVMSDGAKSAIAPMLGSLQHPVPLAKEPGLFDKAEVRRTVREGRGKLGCL